MIWKILLATCALMLLFSAWALVRALRRSATDARRWPFIQQRPLSRPEQTLYFRLVEALPDHVVLAQVQLSRFLRVRKGRNHREWINRVERKSVDYLVCTRDFAIVAAVELDDASHEPPLRAISDANKNRALAAADVPLIRWHVSALPNVDAIRAMVSSVVRDRHGATLPIPSREPALARNLSQTHVEASNDPQIYEAYEEETKT